MSIMQLIPVAFASVALSIGPALAQDVSQRSKARIEAMEKILGLPFEKHQKLSETLKLEPGEDFYHCLCRNAGYGSSSTSQYFHPGTIGEYNPRYSCNQPGDPCIVSGFGCMRYPLPKDKAVWDRCSAEHPGPGGVGFTDAMRDALDKRKPVTPPDYARLYQQCRAQKRLQEEMERGSEMADGYEYLAKNGTPVLAPPPKVARRLKREAEQSQRNIFAEINKAKKKAKNSKNWFSEAAKSAATNPENYKKAAEVALDLAKLNKLSAENKLKHLELDLKELNTRNHDAVYEADLASQRQARRNDLEQRKRKMQAEFDQYERDEKHLESLMSGIDKLQDINAMAGAVSMMASGDPRKQAEGALKNTQLLKKYFDMARQPHSKLAGELKEMVSTKGLSEADFKRFQSYQASEEVLEGASQALGHVIYAADTSIKVHDKYKKFLDMVKTAETYANSGRYTSAQRNLLNAFNVMSELGAEAQPYLPPGISEMMGYYSEAMKTPAKFDKMIRAAVNKSGVAVDIQGEQTHSHAMRRHNALSGATLTTDPYMYDSAGITAYMVGKGEGDKAFALLTDSGKDPIYLNEANFNKLRELAYYFPLAEGRRMTDADVDELFRSIGNKGTINLDAFKNKAMANIKDAAEKQRIARMFGKKTVSKEDESLWSRFNLAMSKALPPGCVLDIETRKKLFSAYREDPNSEGTLAAMWRGIAGTPEKQRGKESVEEFLISYGAKLKRAAFEANKEE